MSKTILITGASKGIGRACAESAATKGLNVIATARNTELLNDLSNNYSNVTAVVSD